MRKVYVLNLFLLIILLFIFGYILLRPILCQPDYVMTIKLTGQNQAELEEKCKSSCLVAYQTKSYKINDVEDHSDNITKMMISKCYCDRNKCDTYKIFST